MTILLSSIISHSVLSSTSRCSKHQCFAAHSSFCKCPLPSGSLVCLVSTFSFFLDLVLMHLFLSGDFLDASVLYTHLPASTAHIWYSHCFYFLSPHVQGRDSTVLVFCLRNLSAQHICNRNILNIDQTNKFMHYVMVIANTLEFLEKDLSGFVQLRSWRIYIWRYVSCALYLM